MSENRRNGRNRVSENRLRKRKRKKQQYIIVKWGIIIAILGLCAAIAACGIGKILNHFNDTTDNDINKVVEDAPDLDVQLLTVNDYSRPGIAMEQINGIVIHYTANPGTTAQQNRDYFEGLKDSHVTKASSHFIIGIEGEVIQCIPSSEISYASNDRNYDTLSIECCIGDDTGKFSDATYDSLVHLTSWLCGKFSIKVDNVIRHYDVTGKECPKYYVKHEDAWLKFKEDIADYINKYGTDLEDVEGVK